jgi:hypothetical protein
MALKEKNTCFSLSVAPFLWLAHGKNATAVGEN